MCLIERTFALRWGAHWCHRQPALRRERARLLRSPLHTSRIASAKKIDNTGKIENTGRSWNHLHAHRWVGRPAMPGERDGCDILAGNDFSDHRAGNEVVQMGTHAPLASGSLCPQARSRIIGHIITHPFSYTNIPMSSISYPQTVLVATSTYLLTINFSVSCFAHTSRHAYTRQLASVNHQLSCPLLRTNDTPEYAVLAILRSISRKLG